MSNALPVTEFFALRAHEEKLVLFASDLHYFLKSPILFKNWWNTVIASGFFVENDYSPVRVPIYGSNRAVEEYAITVSCAARICLLEQTELAKRINKIILELPEQDIVENILYGPDKTLFSTVELNNYEREMEEFRRSYMHALV
ncbi:antA/AntB antirepressor family protein [uncultured Mucilaginibacter sp.]|uniref:antA/AntB antirepressor family protein n=1 Tax=uncultured Mucilaginibacter sp. TaxID=797541 RepID=UPI0025FE9AFD|nr:antA/AntB antirepressor family protein [uncultured Mucilaginibacter sp.]